MKVGRILIAGILGICVPSAALAGGPLKLGVVDVGKVMEAVPAWARAVGGLKKEWEKKQSALEGQQAELKKKKEALDAKKTISDPKSLAAEEGKLMTEARAFTEEAMKAQQEMAGRENKLKEAMLSRIERVVYELAEKDDFTYVFESGAPNAPNVLFSKAGLDVTAQVVALYKERFQDQPIEPLPDGAPKKEGLGLAPPQGGEPKPQFREGSDGKK
jgi:outer membrane protein